VLVVFVTLDNENPTINIKKKKKIMYCRWVKKEGKGRNKIFILAYVK
jgi:hypothetical protein